MAVRHLIRIFQRQLVNNMFIYASLEVCIF